MDFPADTFLVELLIALLVQTVIVGAACLFKACKNDRNSQSSADVEPGVQPDVEMGRVTGGEGDTEDPTQNTASLQHGLADSDGRANRPEAHFPAVVDHLVTDQKIVEASAPVVVDVSYTQQVEVLTESINQALVVEGVDARL